jgi:hypothetical protein
MSEPAIKGTIFQGVIEDLQRLRDSGRVSPQKLADRLADAELDLLDTKVYPSSWYPMESYARITDLLCELEGGDGPDYFRARGAANAKRLIDGGLYSQLDFLKRWERTIEGREDNDLEAVTESYMRSLRLVTSLSGSIYSSGTWTVERDPDRGARVRIEIRDAAAYSEGMRYAIEGFLNECVRAVRSELKRFWVSERVAPDHIRIWMTESLLEFYGIQRP